MKTFSLKIALKSNLVISSKKVQQYAKVVINIHECIEFITTFCNLKFISFCFFSFLRFLFRSLRNLWFWSRRLAWTALLRSRRIGFLWWFLFLWWARWSSRSYICCNEEGNTSKCNVGNSIWELSMEVKSIHKWIMYDKNSSSCKEEKSNSSKLDWS